jgi:hypothetical protein
MAQISPSIEVSSATLVAKGAAVDIHMNVSCDAGSMPFVTVFIAQTSGNRVTQANGAAIFTCTGGPQSLTVTATVQSGLPPLKPADALIQGSMQNPDVPIHVTFRLAKK